jgi:hypothetical protein
VAVVAVGAVVAEEFLGDVLFFDVLDDGVAVGGEWSGAAQDGAEEALGGAFLVEGGPVAGVDEGGEEVLFNGSYVAGDSADLGVGESCGEVGDGVGGEDGVAVDGDYDVDAVAEVVEGVFLGVSFAFVLWELMDNEVGDAGEDGFYVFDACVVLAAVVDDDDVEVVAVVLGEGGSDAAFEVLGGFVVGGDDDGDVLREVGLGALVLDGGGVVAGFFLDAVEVVAVAETDLGEEMGEGEDAVPAEDFKNSPFLLLVLDAVLGLSLLPSPNN